MQVPHIPDKAWNLAYRKLRQPKYNQSETSLCEASNVLLALRALYDAYREVNDVDCPQCKED